MVFDQLKQLESKGVKLQITVNAPQTSTEDIEELAAKGTTCYWLMIAFVACNPPITADCKLTVKPEKLLFSSHRKHMEKSFLLCICQTKNKCNLKHFTV